jgi:hypothetical protein
MLQWKGAYCFVTLCYVFVLFRLPEACLVQVV